MVAGALAVILAACTMAPSGSGDGGSDSPPRLVGYSRQYTLLTPAPAD